MKGKVVMLVLVVIAVAIFLDSSKTFNPGEGVSGQQVRAQPSFVHPVFVYNLESGTKLNYGLCPNARCDPLSPTWQDSTLTDGIPVMGSDQLPVILHSHGMQYGVYHKGLSLTKCLDLRCTLRISNQIEPLLTPYRILSYNINIGSDGFPIVAYIHKKDDDLQSDELIFYKCNDLNCATGIKNVVLDGTFPNNVASGSYYFNVEVQANGNPIMVAAPNDLSGGPRVRVIACTDLSCSQKTVNTITESGAVDNVRMAVGSDGFPVVTYTNFGTGRFYFVHCTTPSCNQYSAPIILHSAAAYANILILPDGMPAITYFKNNAGDSGLVYTKCNDLNCLSRSSVDFPPVGVYGDLVLGADNLPIVFISSPFQDSLSTIKCQDLACQNKIYTSLLNIPDTHSFWGAR